MNVISARNPHHALAIAVELLQTHGVERDSRDGPVLVMESPVTTVYSEPRERVVFWEQRDANPFFHLYESLWMLGGRHDIAPLVRFAANMANYSDDGVTHHGAYGRRWRVGMPSMINSIEAYRPMSPDLHHDQLTTIINRLRENGDDRRCVLQMWDARSDLGHDGKDVPCNVTATFQISTRGRLDMVVFNRSSDVVWGCYGANAVHFSYLQEYVATCVGVTVGTYTQVSVNWHGYRRTFDPLAAKFRERPNFYQPYELPAVKPYSLMQEDRVTWDQDLKRFLSGHGRAPVAVFRDPFFENVAMPLVQAHDAYKDTEGEGRYEAAMRHAARCHAVDWRMAASEWITRRWNKFRKDADDGPTGY